MTQGFDLIVIGGGIAGLGVAVEAARQRLSVLVLEADELGGGTSKSSLRIMHGGFRYLQSFNLRRVIESMRAQHELVARYPEELQQLECLMPLERRGLRSRIPVQTALCMYGALYKMVCGDSYHGRVICSEYTQKIPILAPLAKNGALQWRDYLLRDPQALIARLRTEIIGYEGVVRSHAQVKSVERTSTGFIVATDSETIEGRAVANCAGHAVEALRPKLSRLPRAAHGWCRAFNVILNRSLETEYAVGLRGSDNRLYFTVPRAGVSVVGTQYLPLQGAPKVEDREVISFLRDFAAAVPHMKVVERDIASIEVGILPLAERQQSIGKIALQGRARLLADGNYVEVVSTKYTTFLPQGRAALRSIGC